MECTLALEAHPKFGKALYRRARAYEAMGKLQLALADVQFLLQVQQLFRITHMNSRMVEKLDAVVSLCSFRGLLSVLVVLGKPVCQSRCFEHTSFTKRAATLVVLQCRCYCRVFLTAVSSSCLSLQSESSNQEALELGKRLRAALGNIEGAQQDTQWRSSVSLHASPPDTATSPATPGADGAPGQSGRGPTLPARPPGKKKGRTTTDSEATLRTAGETGTSVPSVTHNTPQPEMSKSGG